MTEYESMVKSVCVCMTYEVQIYEYHDKLINSLKIKKKTYDQNEIMLVSLGTKDSLGHKSNF